MAIEPKDVFAKRERVNLARTEVASLLRQGAAPDAILDAVHAYENAYSVEWEHIMSLWQRYADDYDGDWTLEDEFVGEPDALEGEAGP